MIFCEYVINFELGTREQGTSHAFSLSQNSGLMPYPKQEVSHQNDEPVGEQLTEDSAYAQKADAALARLLALTAAASGFRRQS